jgi:Ca2+-transporting ATPase
VCGDIVLLKTGSKVPADVRLIETTDFAVNEALLTGESVAVKKHTDPVVEAAVLADRTSMVWMGTTVERGAASGVVVATGLLTEMGRIAALSSSEVNSKTPLQQRLQQLARTIGWVVFAVGGLLMVLGVINDIPFTIAFKTAVAVAVAAIPEGLVAALSVVLAVATTRILRQRGLVRTPLAAETLGSTTVVCTDKTGTLTEGIMQVQSAHIVGSNTVPLLTLALANEAVIEQQEVGTVIRGESTDQAKLNYAISQNSELTNARLHYLEQFFLPFDSTAKYIATFVTDPADPGVLRILVCGAPEVLLASSSVLGNGEVLGTSQQISLKAEHDTLARKGLRVIAVADRTVSIKEAPHDIAAARVLIHDLTFRGVYTLADPIRSDVIETLQETRAAGLRVVMVTGDHLLTASAIGATLGFRTAHEFIADGLYLDTLDDDALRRAVSRIEIYCRVTPEHKMRIVQAFLANGESVAMTGDGINDAPALRAADIGIATVSATDVTKEAADLVLLTNGLGTIAAAIREGRIAFDNIKKVALFLFSASFTELILILAAIFVAAPLPLTPVMILWANVIQDGLPTFSLAFERGEQDVMRRPPVPRRAPILDSDGRIIIFGTAVIRDGLLVGVYFFFLWGLSYPLLYAQTIMFAAIAINPLLYIFALRSFRQPIWRTGLRGNWFLLVASAFGLLLAGVAIYHPLFQRYLGTTALLPRHLGVILVVALFNVVVIELVKYVARNRTNPLRTASA